MAIVGVRVGCGIGLRIRPGLGIRIIRLRDVGFVRSRWGFARIQYGRGRAVSDSMVWVLTGWAVEPVYSPALVAFLPGWSLQIQARGFH